jgi:hypothetical protein
MSIGATLEGLGWPKYEESLGDSAIGSLGSGDCIRREGDTFPVETMLTGRGGSDGSNGLGACIGALSGTGGEKPCDP